MKEKPVINLKCPYTLGAIKNIYIDGAESLADKVGVRIKWDFAERTEPLDAAIPQEPMPGTGRMDSLVSPYSMKNSSRGGGYTFWEG